MNKVWIRNQDSATLKIASPARRPASAPLAELATTRTKPTAARLTTVAASTSRSVAAREGSCLVAWVAVWLAFILPTASQTQRLKTAEAAAQPNRGASAGIVTMPATIPTTRPTTTITVSRIQELAVRQPRVDTSSDSAEDVIGNSRL